MLRLIFLLIILNLFVLSAHAEGVFEVVYDPTVDADICRGRRGRTARPGTATADQQHAHGARA